MNKVEKTFDINDILLKVYASLASIRKERKIELIYEMDSTIPKDLKGDIFTLTRLLIQVLTFVCQNTSKKEIVLSLTAPEDFLVEEFVSFKIKDAGISKEKMMAFLEKNIKIDMEKLEGKILYEKDVDMYLDIPFQINELGHRRHYRLPDTGMLDKKVLLLSQSKKLTESIEKMFKYFRYEVDSSFEAFKEHGNDLARYDIVVLDDTYATEAFEEIVAKIQDEIPFKYVLLRDSHIVEMKPSIVVSTHLIKPVTQERVFELISTLFQNDMQASVPRTEVKKYSIDLEKILEKDASGHTEVSDVNTVIGDNLNHVIEAKKEMKLPYLDIKLGEEKTKKLGLKYKDELKKFLEVFDRSDIYFRQIVNEKASTKIKEFCIDLEKHSKRIGAQSMLRFADIVSLIFVHNKLEMLSIYPGRYHIELQNLLTEIRKYLKIK